MFNLPTIHNRWIPDEYSHIDNTKDNTIEFLELTGNDKNGRRARILVGWYRGYVFETGI